MKTLRVPFTLREFRREEEVGVICPGCAPSCVTERKFFPFHQFYKIDLAFRMMQRFETERGKPFKMVIKARPDILYGMPLRFPPRFDTVPPTLCGSIGGGGGDVLLASDRVSFLAVVNVWRMRADCPLQIDNCTSRAPLLRTCRRLGHSEERCDHAVAPSALRHGMRPIHCTVGGSFA